MKKGFRTIFASTLLLGVIGLASSLNVKPVTNVKADETTNYPRNGESGNLLYVNGGSTYFNSGEADLAICCWNNSGYAWSDRVSYRCFGDMLRVMLPYKNGQSQTWSYYKVCRYNPNLDPTISEDSGVYNSTNDISFGSMLYAHNVVVINGYDNGKLTYSFNTSNYYGIRAENHIYLDLSNFTDWEQGNAKFAFYFAYPNQKNETRWSQIYLNGNYQTSFLWKVEGQTNKHLYEGVVPNIFSGDSRNIWNMVIAVRFNPDANEPNWDYKWNQTQNLSFNSGNHNANIVRISNWDNAGEFETDSISREDRVDYYGRYFLDTVTCSGTGTSDVTTSEQWNAVEGAYNHLSKLFQGDVWTASADINGTLVEQAMARYDYIVLYRQYNHVDFINRADPSSGADHSISSTIVVNNIEDNDRLTLIIILASMMTISAITLIVLKKYKSHRR